MKAYSYIVEDEATDKKWQMPTIECVSKHTSSTIAAVYRALKNNKLLKYRWKISKVDNKEMVVELAKLLQEGEQR